MCCQSTLVPHWDATATLPQKPHGGSGLDHAFAPTGGGDVAGGGRTGPRGVILSRADDMKVANPHLPDSLPRTTRTTDYGNNFVTLTLANPLKLS